MVTKENAPGVTTDGELVASTLEGSDSSFTELVERYQKRLYRFLLARCASRADAEDALQETFVSAFRYLPSYQPRWHFSTWLYRIAIRNAARLQTRPTVALEEVPDPAADPLLACIRESEMENAWRLAKRLLSPDACTALWLRYVEDMPVKDVARALGRPQSWTKVTLLRARRRLNRALVDEAGVSEGKVYG